jgi:Ni/Fe-hydrogenase subunit HybB-like protein
MNITSQITSIHSKQAAKITAVMAFVAILAATWPLAGAAWAFSVHLPRKHFMILLFVPFFYALATYFLVGMGCALYNLAARTVGGLRIEVAHHTYDTEIAPEVVDASAEKPAALRKVA